MFFYIFFQSSLSKGDKYGIKINGYDHPALLINRRNSTDLQAEY